MIESMIIPSFSWLSLVILIICAVLLQGQGVALAKKRAFQITLLVCAIAILLFGNWATHSGLWRLDNAATSHFGLPFFSIEELALWLSFALVTILLFEHLEPKKTK